jgi:ribosomal protein S18 acetylase RimI-like enzyme
MDANADDAASFRSILMSIHIRPARDSDVDAIASLWLELVAYHVQVDAMLPSATEHGERSYARRIRDQLPNRSACVLVAEVDSQVIGYVLGVIVELIPEMFQQEPSGFLADIYVKAEYRRDGVGRGLVQALATWFASKGLRYFEWHVAAQNSEGIAFWKALQGRDVMVRMRSDIHPS